VVESLRKLGVDCLITIGGDDTATSARAVAEKAQGSVRVVHVPKTIDNDLPLPDGIPTFGFETAREHAAQIVSSLIEDARTTGRWYFAVVMGRNAGHLALGAGKAAGATLSLIPEEFAEGPISLDHVSRLLEGAIVKQLAKGHGHGVAVLAEGIGERLDPSELELVAQVERDEHGHIRLAEVPLGKVLRDRVRAALAARGVSLTIGEKNIGYELRCVSPTAFDLDYTRDLGAGAVQALLGGASGVLITRQGGAIVPLDLQDLRDPETGHTRIRLVDTSTASHSSARALQERLEAADLEDADRLDSIAAAAGLAPEEARAYFQGVV
jgi:6-phosphofructokinase 1